MDDLTGPSLGDGATSNHTNIDNPMDVDETPSNVCDTSEQKTRVKPTKQHPSSQPLLRKTLRTCHEMVIVLVGEEQVKYYLHKGLLTAVSPFFAACLDGNFSEATEQTVRLPEERPDIFDWFAQWLYAGSLSTPAGPNCNAQSRDTSQAPAFPPTHDDGGLRNAAGMPKYFLLFDIYALSDRLLTTSLSNHVIDTVARLSEATNSVPTPSDTWLLYGDCASMCGLHHCSCRSPFPRYRVAAPSTDPYACYTATHSHGLEENDEPSPLANPGIRATAPLRDLIIDLFMYKKTDRLLQSHKDDWHPLFLRDLVVRLKRPGHDVLARHALRPWLPRAWIDARACEACHRVLMISGASTAAAAAADPLSVHNVAAAMVTTGAPSHRHRHRHRAAQQTDTASSENDAPDTPPFALPRRCARCDRVYCASCLSYALGGGLAAGDVRFALVGGDIGPCKPWLTWDETGLMPDQALRAAARRTGAVEPPARGVCGRYHEHGPLGARVFGSAATVVSRERGGEVGRETWGRE